MPLRIQVKVDTSAARKQLGALRDQLHKATATAINLTAQQAARDVNAAIPRVFQHAVPFTRNAVVAPASLKAKPDRLTAVVLVKDQQAKYLWLEEFGGTRTPANQAIVVRSKGARLNAYGNLPKGYVAKLAEQARQMVAAQTGQRRRGKASVRRNSGVFELKGSGVGGRGPGGFFRRLPNGHVMRLISFEAATTYKPKFGFEQLVQQSVARTFRSNLDRAIADRLARAGR